MSGCRDVQVPNQATREGSKADTGTAKQHRPILRANPFPEVTDLFCRLPLSTLFYRPEAANLGDLMRLWVRPNWDISDLDFQGSSRAHLTSQKSKMLCHA